MVLCSVTKQSEQAIRKGQVISTLHGLYTSSYLQVPTSLEFLSSLLWWWTAIWKNKPNKSFHLQVTLVMIFHHSNRNSKTYSNYINSGCLPNPKCMSSKTIQGAGWWQRYALSDFNPGTHIKNQRHWCTCGPPALLYQNGRWTQWNYSEDLRPASLEYETRQKQKEENCLNKVKEGTDTQNNFNLHGTCSPLLIYTHQTWGILFKTY